MLSLCQVPCLVASQIPSHLILRRLGKQNDLPRVTKLENGRAVSLTTPSFPPKPGSSPAGSSLSPMALLFWPVLCHRECPIGRAQDLLFLIPFRYEVAMMVTVPISQVKKQQLRPERVEPSQTCRIPAPLTWLCLYPTLCPRPVSPKSGSRAGQFPGQLRNFQGG